VNPAQQSNRRDFLKTTSAAAIATAAIPSTMRAGTRPTRSPNDRIRIAVVGTGGRGTGATRDNLVANGNTELVAVADLHRDKAVAQLKHLKGNKQFGDRVMVADKDIYGGLEGLDKVLERRDVDLVLLTTPPGFRPEYIKKAVAAGKHIFAEKPVCVDPAGYRICCEAHDAAKAQGTAIVTGTQYRRQTSFKETIDILHKGVIGDIIAMTARYCSSGIWYRKRKPDMTDMEYQIHNWMHFVWLSGDQIAEQAVHNIDAMNWVMQGPPERCYASGGRFYRPADSEMWDTMSIDYEYPGKKLVSFKCRQLAGTHGSNNNVIYCQGGRALIKSFSGTATITDADGKTISKIKGNIGAAYKQEHKDLVDSIVAGKPIVELRQTAESSLTAIMGRMSAYTGKRVDWTFAAEKSKLDLYPQNLTLATPIQSPGYALPGKTKLI
jgi:predicted dehydrogenase